MLGIDRAADATSWRAVDFAWTLLPVSGRDPVGSGGSDDMAVLERPAPVEHKGLRREVGFIGLIWASEGSIIGSGWLFGAQGALGTAGPAAIISWGIGGVAILILALVHAELGRMYPVSGGTARFPHYAFGGAAGASFGSPGCRRRRWRRSKCWQ